LKRALALERDGMHTSLKPVLISEKEIQDFREATQTQTDGFPLTFVTKYRQLEFELLKELNVDFHQLLHLEQTYHYFEPVTQGDLLEVSTRISENKMKKGTQFITLETVMSSAGVKKVMAISKMVVRVGEELGK